MTILCAVFALGAYPVAGVSILGFGVGAILVTVLAMLEAGKRYERVTTTVASQAPLASDAAATLDPHGDHDDR